MGPMQESRDDARQTGFAIEWRDAYRIGLEEIDEEHRNLFLLVKSLSLQSIDDALEQLLHHVGTHFGHEEQMMERSAFPEYRMHLDLHESFNAQLAEWLSSGLDWSPERVEELRQFLNNWLITHILGDDLRFGRWLWMRSLRRPRARQKSAKRPGWFHRLLDG
jgi:hemerythrin-like metal-binding protein